MEDADFDTLTRWVTRRASRRTALGAAVIGALSTVFSAPDSDAKKCKQPCGPCKKCNTKKGKCKPKPDGTTCGEGKACLKGACTCMSTHFKCGTKCCLDGATCLPVFGSTICFGTKQPGEACDPNKPGQCASGRCGCSFSGQIQCYCREAECRVQPQKCASLVDCCSGDCQPAADACGGGTRCCGGLNNSCQDDCECCGFPDEVCRQGRCCVKSGKCNASTGCCDGLVCSEGQCVKP
jgi:hypothetical protein